MAAHTVVFTDLSLRGYTCVAGKLSKKQLAVNCCHQNCLGLRFVLRDFFLSFISSSVFGVLFELIVFLTTSPVTFLVDFDQLFKSLPRWPGA